MVDPFVRLLPLILSPIALAASFGVPTVKRMEYIRAAATPTPGDLQ